MKKTERKEAEIYAYIKNSILKNGFAPSVRDICAVLQIKSTSTVQLYLDKLEESGQIIRDKNKSRSIRLASKKETRNIPCINAKDGSDSEYLYSGDNANIDCELVAINTILQEKIICKKEEKYAKGELVAYKTRDKIDVKLYDPKDDILVVGKVIEIVSNE